MQKFFKEHAVTSYALFMTSVGVNTTVKLTTMANTAIGVGHDSSGLYVAALDSPIMQKARIVKSDVMVKKGVVHYIDYPLTTEWGE